MLLVIELSLAMPDCCLSGATTGNNIYWAVALDNIHTTSVEAFYRLYLEKFHKIAFTPEDIHKIWVCL